MTDCLVYAVLIGLPLCCLVPCFLAVWNHPAHMDSTSPPTPTPVILERQRLARARKRRPFDRLRTRVFYATVIPKCRFWGWRRKWLRRVGLEFLLRPLPALPDMSARAVEERHQSVLARLRSALPKGNRRGSSR